MGGLQSTVLLLAVLATEPCTQVLSGESSQHVQCSFPLSTPVTVFMLFPKDIITQGWGGARLSMCSCASSRYCNYLRFSRQECFSARLPNINNLQLVVFPKMETLNLELKDSTSCCHCLTSICFHFSVLPFPSFLVLSILPAVPCAASG